MRRSSPFGSRTHTRPRLALPLAGESPARELERLTETRLRAVQGAPRSLERDGLVGVTAAGRTRVHRFEPRCFAARELRALLQRPVAAEPRLAERVHGLRGRPRRGGRPL